MNKKRVILIVICVIISILLLWLILRNVLLRTPVDLEMVCAEVARDGTVISTGETVTIKGYEQKKIFSDTEVELVLEHFMLPVFPVPMKSPPDEPVSIFCGKGGAYALGFGLVANDYTTRSFYISLEEDWKTCLIRLDGNEYYYACSYYGAVPVSEIVEIHKWMLD